MLATSCGLSVSFLLLLFFFELVNTSVLIPDFYFFNFLPCLRGKLFLIYPCPYVNWIIDKNFLHAQTSSNDVNYPVRFFLE